MNFLNIPSISTIQAEKAGLYISRNFSRHPDRTINTYELFLVRTGCLYIAEEDTEFAINKGEVLILHPGRRHRGTHDFGKDLSFYWIHFSLPDPATPSTIALPQHIKPARPERLSELFHRYLDDQEADLLTREEAAHLVALMLLEAHRSATEGVSPVVSTLANRAHRFIDENFHRGIHASDIGKALGCSSDYLGTIYRKTFGKTLSHAIHQRQIAEARILLRESSKNIEAVAQSCGFSESRYFRRLFVQHQGLSPLAYRKLYTRRKV